MKPQRILLAAVAGMSLAAFSLLPPTIAADAKPKYTTEEIMKAIHKGDDSIGKRVGKDSAGGKLTFPGLLGIEESARRAEQLVAQARAALEPLGARGQHLDVLALYVLERDR